MSIQPNMQSSSMQSPGTSHQFQGAFAVYDPIQRIAFQHLSFLESFFDKTKEEYDDSTFAKLKGVLNAIRQESIIINQVCVQGNAAHSYALEQLIGAWSILKQCRGLAEENLKMKQELERVRLERDCLLQQQAPHKTTAKAMNGKQEEEETDDEVTAINDKATRRMDTTA